MNRENVLYYSSFRAVTISLLSIAAAISSSLLSNPQRLTISRICHRAASPVIPSFCHETAATAFGVYFKLNSFIFMPIFGLNNGVIPIVAYNYGAQNRRRMMATIKRSTLYACCIMVFGTVLFWAIPDTLLRLFDASDVMLAAGVPALRIISLSYCMAGACIALGSSFQALGKSMYSMITSIVRQLVFLIPIAYVLARYGASVGNSDLVWWCYPLAEIFSLTLTLVFFSRMYKTIIAPLPEGHE